MRRRFGLGGSRGLEGWAGRDAIDRLARGGGLRCEDRGQGHGGNRHGGWLLGDDGQGWQLPQHPRTVLDVDYDGQRTPAQALRSFVRAIEHRLAEHRYPEEGAVVGAGPQRDLRSVVERVGDQVRVRGLNIVGRVLAESAANGTVQVQAGNSRKVLKLARTY